MFRQHIREVQWVKYLTEPAKCPMKPMCRPHGKEMKNIMFEMTLLKIPKLKKEKKKYIAEFSLCSAILKSYFFYQSFSYIMLIRL